MLLGKPSSDCSQRRGQIHRPLLFRGANPIAVQGLISYHRRNYEAQLCHLTATSFFLRVAVVLPAQQETSHDFFPWQENTPGFSINAWLIGSFFMFSLVPCLFEKGIIMPAYFMHRKRAFR